MPLLPLRQRLIGTSLRRYREEAGLDLLDAARILDCDRSRISRIESGERGIRLAELHALLGEYGADDAGRDALDALARAARDGWWRDYLRALSAGYVDLLIAESAAKRIMIYAPLQVPELLRTEGYARVAVAGDGNGEEMTDVAVAAMMARQHAVLRGRGTRVAVVLGEAALRQEVGGADVLRGQLRHLTGRGLPGTAIQVLPFTAGIRGTSGGFTILQFGPALPPGLVVVDAPDDGGIYLDAPESVAAYNRAFTRFRGLALSPGDSARMLREVARA
jgi:transcriptional regulator with XRE-family HTH domain